VDARKAFGQQLKKIREQKGMTQEYLAEIIGISDRQIRNYEGGVQGPTFGNLEKLAKVLGVRIRDLFDFSDSDL